MITESLNIYSFLSIFTAISSILIFVQGIVQRPFKQANYTFSIFSAVIFFISLSSAAVLMTSNYSVALAWMHLMIAAILFFPVSLLHFILEISDYNISGIRKIYKFLFYLVPSAIFIYLISISEINVGQTALGFQLNTSGVLVYISEIYLTGAFMLMLWLLGRESFKRYQSNRSSRVIMFVFSGILLYIFCNIIYWALFMGGIVSRIPTTSVFLFVMYFFISIATLFSRYGISNMSLKEIFEKSDEFIIAVDATCKSLEINSKLYNVLYKSLSKKTKNYMNFMDLKNLGEKLSGIFPEKDIIKALFDNLLGSSSATIRKEITGSVEGKTKTYDVVIFPVLDNIQKLLGKIAIFRDISDYKKLQESLREESIKDFLTDSYNRKYFYESLIMHINRFERYNEQFSLVMIDIDKFKLLNDRHGHLKGDWILQETARILKENIRDHIDVVSRYGGDEFLLILSSTTSLEAQIISQRIKLEYSSIDNEGTSLSIGICQFAEGMSSDEVIKRADSAMYKSKASGGNLVTVI